MANFKPTLKDPMSPQSEKFEKDFKKTMIKSAPNVAHNLNETDNLLTEKEQSLKKKIWSLGKMESLVFSDPKLSAVYEEMAENGEEKYGYHYNETIQNMIFNDYVLNSPQYLQKYKQAIPKEKKRRDKSGINQLKKAGEKKMDATGTKLGNPKDMNEADTEKTVVNFLVHPEHPEVYAYFPNENHDITGKYKTGYAHVGQHSAIDPNYAAESREASPEEFQELKSELEGLGYNLEIINGLSESSTAGSAGGAQGYTGFAGPAAFSTKGDLSGDMGKKNDPKAKPISTGFALSENNYLTDPSGFEKMFNSLNEETDANFIADNGSNTYGDVTNMNPQNQKIIKKDIQSGKLNNNNNIKDGIALQEEDLADSVEENNIKEDTQTMIQNNGTSMSNKAQATGDMSSEVPQGTQQQGGLNEADTKLLEEINKELEAFSVHHEKLKLMAEERKTNSQVLNARVGGENSKNFKKDLQHSGTKEVIDVEKELQWKDQQTDVPKDPQKLGQDIEKQAIKVSDMKGDEALKNVGDSANNEGDEIPKRNLTSKEQEEVDLYRNGLHSTTYDNEPSERFVERMKADQGQFFEMGEKQKEFKAGAPMYNKEEQPVEDTEVDKVQFDKNEKGKGDKVAWNQRMGFGSNMKLSESMITGRYRDGLNKSRLLEFNLTEVNEFADDKGDGFATEHLFEMDFTGLGNKYLNKSVDKKVLVNESVVGAMDSNKFYTDGKQVFAMKNPVQNLSEGSVKEEKPVISEQELKMKHLLGYKPQDFVSTKNVKKDRGF